MVFDVPKVAREVGALFAVLFLVLLLVLCRGVLVFCKVLLGVPKALWQLGAG